MEWYCLVTLTDLYRPTRRAGLSASADLVLPRATLCGRSYCVRLSHLRVVSKRLKISGFSRPGGSHKILVFTQATLQNYCNGNTEWRPEIDVGTRQRENSHFTVNVLLCLGNRRFSHGISI